MACYIVRTMTIGVCQVTFYEGVFVCTTFINRAGRRKSASGSLTARSPRDEGQPRDLSPYCSRKVGTGLEKEIRHMNRESLRASSSLRGLVPHPTFRDDLFFNRLLLRACTHTGYRIVSLTCFGHWTGTRDLLCHRRVTRIAWHYYADKNLLLIFFRPDAATSTQLCTQLSIIAAVCHLSLVKSI